LLERWPRWWGVGNLFATAAVGNDAQRKKGQSRSTPMPHFLLTFGDASRPPVGAVILEALSMQHARMTAVVRRLASGVPFGEGLQLSARMMTSLSPTQIGRMMSGAEAAELILQFVEGRRRPKR
jgi:hypothetical protein